MGQIPAGRSSKSDKTDIASAAATQREARLNRCGQNATDSAATAELRPITAYRSPAISAVAYCCGKGTQGVLGRPKKGTHAHHRDNRHSYHRACPTVAARRTHRGRLLPWRHGAGTRLPRCRYNRQLAGMDRKSRNQRDGHDGCQGERQPGCHHAGQDTHQGRAQDEGDLVRGPFIGQRGVQVSPVGRDASASVG